MASRIDFRVTFDSKIITRRDDFKLRKRKFGEELLEKPISNGN